MTLELLPETNINATVFFLSVLSPKKGLFKKKTKKQNSMAHDQDKYKKACPYIQFRHAKSSIKTFYLLFNKAVYSSAITHRPHE